MGNENHSNDSSPTPKLLPHQASIYTIADATAIMHAQHCMQIGAETCDKSKWHCNEGLIQSRPPASGQWTVM